MYIIKNGELRYVETNHRPHLSHAVENGRTFIVSDNELYHWKYIKRERKNGRWVYYYDTSDVDAARSSLNDVQKRIKQNERYLDGIYKEIRNAKDPSNKAVFQKRADKQGTYHNRLIRQAQYYTEQYEKVQAESLARRQKAETVIKVANFISSALSKIGNLFKKEKKKKNKNKNKSSKVTSKSNSSASKKTKSNKTKITATSTFTGYR